VEKEEVKEKSRGDSAWNQPESKNFGNDQFSNNAPLAPREKRGKSLKGHTA